MRLSPLAIVSAVFLLALIFTGYGNLQLRQELKELRDEKQALARQHDALTQQAQQERSQQEQIDTREPLADAAPTPPEPDLARDTAAAPAAAAAAPPEPVGPPLTLAEIMEIDDEEVRAEKMHEMVRDLIINARGLDETQRQALLQRMERHSAGGLDENLAPFLAGIIGALPDNAILVKRWQENFWAHPDRAQIFSRLAGTNPPRDPAAWQQLTQDWTPWEQELYRNNMLRALAEESPAEALAVAQKHRDLFGDTTLRRMFQRYAQQNPEEFQQTLRSLSDPRMREIAITARAESLAYQNTIAALDWADNLPTQPERDRAHEVIYENTPRGIGAMVRHENGFPTIVEPMEGGPSMGLLQPGDRIVRITEGDGTSTDLYARPFREAIESIRGEPGTPVTLKVLRWNEAAGQMSEMDITLNREQLYIDSSDGQG